MNLATCNHCGGYCSLTAATCPHCGRSMKLGDLSKSNIVKPVNSRSPSILIYPLAVIGGLAANLVGGFIGAMTGIPLALSACITLLLSGALFGFVWSNVGWKWGLWMVAFSNVVWFVVTVTLDINSFSMFYTFLIQTVPLLASCCLGAYIGAIYKQKQDANNASK